MVGQWRQQYRITMLTNSVIIDHVGDIANGIINPFHATVRKDRAKVLIPPTSRI
ncbi:unnamed protein product [Penicillium camemberti]|uniref:Str. FM013 n=1 Tax=Penicillium camemberti (strain FM 013) TaxID=1429867 RepID=A0A0G4PBQ3_PENC3|nr:unnamed protein product [Penicillium camemberti]